MEKNIGVYEIRISLEDWGIKMIIRATANKIGFDYYGLVEGKEYVLEKANHEGMWFVYDKGTYITAGRTDCFDNFKANCEK